MSVLSMVLSREAVEKRNN